MESLSDRIQGCLGAMFPATRVDKAVVRSQLVKTKSSSAHFYRDDGVNALVAVTEESPFSTKKHSHVQVWLGAGGGVSLMREYMVWLKHRRAIRTASVTPLFDDPRLERVMGRFGFRRVGGSYFWERG